MIRPEDLGEAVRFLLRTSRNCHVPEIVFTRPGEGLDTPYGLEHAASWRHARSARVLAAFLRRRLRRPGPRLPGDRAGPGAGAGAATR